MSYTIESVNNETRKVIFDFSSLDLTQDINEAVAKKQKKLHLKGFRKGKAPLTLIRKLYAPTLEKEVLNSFIMDNAQEVMTKEKMIVLAPFFLENLKYDPGKSVSFEIIVKILPPIKQLKDYSHLSFEEDKVKVTQKELDTIEQRYMGGSELREIQDKNRQLEEKLVAIVDLKGKKASEEGPDGLINEVDVLIEMGSQNRFPKLKEALLGMRVGDEKTFSALCPDNFYITDYQNEDIEFKVKVLEIKEKIYPKIDEHFLEQFGCESVEDFKQTLEEDLFNEKKKMAKDKLLKEIIETFIQENSYTIPQEAIDLYRAKIEKDMKNLLTKTGTKGDGLPKIDEETLNTRAEFAVKIFVIMEALGKELMIDPQKSDYGSVINALSKKIPIKLNNDHFQKE